LIPSDALCMGSVGKQRQMGGVCVDHQASRENIVVLPTTLRTFRWAGLHLACSVNAGLFSSYQPAELRILRHDPLLHHLPALQHVPKVPQIGGVALECLHNLVLLQGVLLSWSGLRRATPGLQPPRTSLAVLLPIIRR